MSEAATAPDPVSGNDSAPDPGHERQVLPDSSEPCPPRLEELAAKLVKEMVDVWMENARPSAVDYLQVEKSDCNLERGMTRRKLLSHYYGSTSHNTTVVVAALIVSSCFTALFQPPGGIDSVYAESGAILRHQFAFKFFFVSNGLAMVIACFSIFLLMTARPLKEGGSQFLLATGRFLVGLAVHFALLAFFSAGYLVIGRELSLLSTVLVPVLASGGFFFLLYYAILVFQVHGSFRGSTGYDHSQQVPMPDIQDVDVLQSHPPSLGPSVLSVPPPASPPPLSSTTSFSAANTDTNRSILPKFGEWESSGTPVVGDGTGQRSSPLSGKTPPSRSPLDGRTPPSRSPLDGRTPPSRSPLDGRTPISRSPQDGRTPPSRSPLVNSFTLAMNTPPRTPEV